MTILSWNVLFSNATMADVFTYIRSTNADIICLQEVSDELLGQLRTLSYGIASATEVDRLFAGVHSTEHVVILSRYPIQQTGSFVIPPFEPHEPLRTRMASFIMNKLAMWARGLGNRHGVFVDVVAPNGSVVRVICVHLSLTYPSRRYDEFALTLTARNVNHPTIIAGDFNTIESYKMSVLNWILGGPLQSMFFPKAERTLMEQTFAREGLTNPLKGLITHRLSASQLDHILVPRDASVSEMRVEKEAYGSDHQPVMLTVEIEPHALPAA